MKAISKYQKSIQQAVFKLPRSQTISCIGYNINLQTAVAAILVFIECPKLLVAEVLVVLRPYQNVKSIQQVVFKISRSQAISCIGYNINLQTVVAILKDKYPNFEVELKCIIMVNPYLLVCSYIRWKSDVNK